VAIENLRKAKNPTWKTKAFFTIRTKNFLIHDCRLVLAPTGRLIAHLPYKEYMENGQKRYEPVIEFLDVDYLEAVTAQAIEAYESLLGNKKRPPRNINPDSPKG
jgi:hypothetical protein